MKRKNEGITLVALVITIIILLILAGITISTLTQNGLFEKAKQAKVKSEEAQELENTTLAKYENEVDKYLNGSQRENNEKRRMLWERNPEATDVNNGKTLGTIVLSDSIDKYDAIIVTAYEIDANGYYTSARTMTIPKENYYLNSENIDHYRGCGFEIGSNIGSRALDFTFINNTNVKIGYVSNKCLLNICGINF